MEEEIKELTDELLAANIGGITHQILAMAKCDCQDKHQETITEGLEILNKFIDEIHSRCTKEEDFTEVEGWFHKAMGD